MLNRVDLVRLLIMSSLISIYTVQPGFFVIIILLITALSVREMRALIGQINLNDNRKESTEYSLWKKVVQLTCDEIITFKHGSEIAGNR